MMPNQDELLWMYRIMVTSRKFEEAIAKIYFEGKTPVFNMADGPIPGEMHLSDGQEPVAVGVCAHLNADDVVTATHRPHHQAIAKGVDLKKMTSEIFGKETGLSGGRGGHMHLFDANVNFACSGIVAQGMGPAVGAALSRKMQSKPGVAVAFIGEGAVNQGAFHESMNLAAVWNLPFICVIEDNAWGISVAKATSTAIANNAERSSAYGIPGERIEGNDPYAIYEAAGKAVKRAREGKGPTLLEIETYRLAGHFMGDAEGYRPEGEKDALFAKDPIPAMRTRMLADKVTTDSELDALETKCESTVEEAIDFARNSKEPNAEDALTAVFAN